MRRIAVFLLLCCVFPLLADEKATFFKKGDRITFLGDSITAQYQYSSYIELYLTTRYPDWKLMFLNAGIGGDTANGGAGRFQRTVLDDKPTVVTINFGMNDAGYGAFNANANKVYVEKTTAMLDMAKKAGVRVALISPNAVDRRKNPNFKLYLETQKQFYAPLKEIAEKNGATFVDQYAVTRAAVEKLETENKTTIVPYYDGFHTSSSGGMLMAHSILTGLKVPALVSQVSIDVAGSPKKADSQQCKVSNLTATETSVKFERLDEALPLPVMPDWVTLLPYMNDFNDLNVYGLKIDGLKSGQYDVLVDGVKIHTASAEELNKGLNLGNVTKGPIFDQSKKVKDLIDKKNQLVADRFFNVILFNGPAWLADVVKERRPAELAKRLAEIEQKQSQVHEAAKPVPHQFEVRPAEATKSKS